MTSRDFCYWFQGSFEVSENNKLNEKQVEIIKKHLNLVFVHEIDSSMDDAKHQKKLNEIHRTTDGSTNLRC